jgi:hypothetical protein
MERNNLIVLVQQQGKYTLTVLTVEDTEKLYKVSHNFHVDDLRGIYSFDKDRNIEIGKERSSDDGVIGVYDRTNLQHLTSMVNMLRINADAKELRW